MDGEKKKKKNNIFCGKGQWRSLKYEEAYLKAYVTVAEAKTQIGTGSCFTTTNALTKP